jgi:hypothetical protein
MIPMAFRSASKYIAKQMLERYEDGERQVETATRALNEKQRAEFNLRYKARKKSLKKSYLYCLLGGFHYAYFGDWTKFILFALTTGGLFAWWAWDLGTLPFKVADLNQQQAMAIIKSITTRDLKVV